MFENAIQFFFRFATHRFDGHNWPRPRDHPTVDEDLAAHEPVHDVFSAIFVLMFVIAVLLLVAIAFQLI